MAVNIVSEILSEFSSNNLGVSFNEEQREEDRDGGFDRRSEARGI